MQQSAVMRAQGATGTTAAELQFHLHDFTLRYANQIEETAWRVLAEQPEPLVRLAVLRWRLNAVLAFQKPLFQPDPLLAVVDAWLLAEQIVQFYQEGAGQGTLGAFEAPVMETCVGLRNELEGLFTLAAGNTSGKDIDRAWVEEWARAHPLRSHFFVRQSVAPEAARTLAATGTTLSSALTSAQSALDILNARMTLFIEMIPKQIAWQAELTAAEMLIDPATGTMTLENLIPVTEILDRTRVLADAQMKAAFENVERLRTTTLEDLKQERVAILAGVSAERKAAFVDVAGERQAVLDAIAGERALILEAVQKEIQEATARLTEERRAALVQVEAMAEKSIRDTGVMSAELLDRLFWRLLALVGVVFALVLVYRFVAVRSADRQAGSE